MTAALEGGEWSAARPGRTLPPGKIRYTLYRRLGGPQGRSGRAENLAPPGFDARTVQPVVSRYIDCANNLSSVIRLNVGRQLGILTLSLSEIYNHWDIRQRLMIVSYQRFGTRLPFGAA